VVKFLADRTAECSMIGCWHDAIIRLFVDLSVCDSVLWLNDTSNSVYVWTVELEVPPRNMICQLSTPYIRRPYPLNSPPLAS